ncbi:MAG: ComF family protein [Clostridia bacterium]|nr:ComF family protein [Clostridia bacterium]
MPAYNQLYAKIIKGGRTIIENILNLIYPPKCGICGKLNQNYLCKKCQKKLETQAKFEIQEIKNNFFQKHLYIFKYEGMIRKIILDYKFNEKSYLYKTIINFILQNKKIFKIFKSYDTIIPVPISYKRYIKRGYNQSYLIAKQIAQNAGNDLVCNSLYKTKNIIEQSKLSKEEREKNIQGVYGLKNEKQLENKKILLVDDIYTTGSTATECCKTLKKANPKKIDVFTIAKD